MNLTQNIMICLSIMGITKSSAFGSKSVRRFDETLSHSRPGKMPRKCGEYLVGWVDISIQLVHGIMGSSRYRMVITFSSKLISSNHPFLTRKQHTNAALASYSKFQLLPNLCGRHYKSHERSSNIISSTSYPPTGKRSLLLLI
jgi:hypothetical protein